jgi:mono/diheme cytochrome c family protein
MLALLLVFFACDDHKFSGGHSTEPVTETGFEGAQAIFTASCSGCHGGSFPPLDGDLCADVVDVSSAQVPEMLLISAGSSEDSYLYQKLANAHLDVGGEGGQMPLGGSLEASEIDIIAGWIDDGAACE